MVIIICNLKFPCPEIANRGGLYNILSQEEGCLGVYPLSLSAETKGRVFDLLYQTYLRTSIGSASTPSIASICNAEDAQFRIRRKPLVPKVWHITDVQHCGV